MSWLICGREDERTDRERYLENELQREREAQECLRQEQRERQEAREQEQRREYEESKRTASDWPEALRKQRHLYQCEVNQFTDDDEPDDFFGPGAQACVRALELWAEEKQRREAAIAALQSQITALRAEVSQAVGDRLASECDAQGWLEVARALRSDEDPSDWLQW